MSREDEEDVEVELSPWEQEASAELAERSLPMWEYKARAAHYAQGHRGILDLDLEFPEKYLRGPAIECYVWKIEVADGTRVHAYADIDGQCFHLRWQPSGGALTQDQPEHLFGPCSDSSCEACSAAKYIADLCVAPGPG